MESVNTQRLQAANIRDYRFNGQSLHANPKFETRISNAQTLLLFITNPANGLPPYRLLIEKF